jgi:hypothetical protein
LIENKIIKAYLVLADDYPVVRFELSTQRRFVSSKLQRTVTVRQLKEGSIPEGIVVAAAAMLG